MSELRVFTSRYHNPNVVLCNLEKVGITLYSPRFGLKYRVAANVRDLAPDPYMLGLSKAKGHVAFAREYRKKLEKLGAPAIQQSTMFCASWPCGPAAGPIGVNARRP